MPVYCSHCSEELFGAVNRCWKCGRHFTARPTGGDTPPVRRAPVSGPVMFVREERGLVILDDVGRPVVNPAALPLEAMVISDEPLAAEIVAEPPPQPLVATIAEPPPETVASTAAPETPAAGSPFVVGWIDSGPAPGPRGPEPEAPPPAEDFVSSTASSASIALGAIGLIAAIFHWWPLALGFAGVAAGVWGLRSKQPGLAAFGLGLSCAAMAAAEFQAAMVLYQEFTGVHPFAM